MLGVSHPRATGYTLTITDPTGADIVIARREKTEEEKAAEEEGKEADPSIDEFIALSSVCTHLGCRVHWEANNKRFFCPCHNGVFDAEGKATEGPPAATDPPQTLSRYQLQIDGGNLMIEVPTESVGVGSQRVAACVSASDCQAEEA